LADTLTTTYQKGREPGTKVKIAVFKFTSTKDLENRHIGLAISELLTHNIATKPEFTVVERLGLDKILAELKINLSGATNPDDALEAGKLSGARFVILGSVEKIGPKYHVNARFVEVETGQVIATAYESFPISVFEEEAKDFIIQTPGKQSIGLYALANWRYNKNLSRQETMTSTLWGGTTATVKPKAFNLLLGGIGLRYSPSTKFMLDFSAMSTGTMPKAGHITEVFNATQAAFLDSDYPAGATIYRGLVSRKITLAPGLFGHFGIGYAHYRIVSTNITPINNSANRIGFAKASYWTPCVQYRTEYFLQTRVGVSLSGNYDFISKPAKQLERDEITRTKRIELNKFYIESDISLYF